MPRTESRSLVEMMETMELPPEVFHKVVENAATEFFKDNLDLFEPYWRERLEEVQADEENNARITKAIGKRLAKMIEDGGIELFDLSGVEEFIQNLWGRTRELLEDAASRLTMR